MNNPNTLLRCWAICVLVACIVGLAASVWTQDSHSNPLCPRCASEYSRGYDNGMVAVMEQLERQGFAEFDKDTREWRPVRVVTLEALMKERKEK